MGRENSSIPKHSRSLSLEGPFLPFSLVKLMIFLPSQEFRDRGETKGRIFLLLFERNEAKRLDKHIENEESRVIAERKE